jgi:hypothetical protein
MCPRERGLFKQEARDGGCKGFGRPRILRANLRVDGATLPSRKGDFSIAGEPSSLNLGASESARPYMRPYSVFFFAPVTTSVSFQ